MSNEKLQEFSGGEIYFWIEQESSIHLKAITKHGDPVELTSDEARELAKALWKAADWLERPNV